ncbi:MAG: hypothetical protein AB1546_11080 [bacterium]
MRSSECGNSDPRTPNYKFVFYANFFMLFVYLIRNSQFAIRNSIIFAIIFFLFPFFAAFSSPVDSEPIVRMSTIDMDILRRCAPRPAGMGGAFTAVEGDPIALFWNPAAAMRADRLTISGNHSLRHFPGGKKNLDQFDSDTTAIIVPLEDEAVLGIGFTVPGEWGIDHTDTNGVVPEAEKYHGRERLIAFTEAKPGERTAAGTVYSDWYRYHADVNISELRTPNYELRTPNTEYRQFNYGGGFSFFYRGAGGFTYGINLKGLKSLVKRGGGKGGNSALRTPHSALNIRIGVAYQGRGRSKTLVAADAEILFGARTRLRGYAGVERRLEDRGFLRIGTMNGMPTYGIGAKSGGLRLDYAVVKNLLPNVTGKKIDRFKDGHFLSYTLGL